MFVKLRAYFPKATSGINRPSTLPTCPLLHKVAMAVASETVPC